MAPASTDCLVERGGAHAASHVVVVAADHVLVELTPYDLTKARITYRFMPGRGGPGPQSTPPA